LQGKYTLKDARAGACDNIVLKDPAKPLPTSIESTNFNEDAIPNRPDKESFIDGVLQN